MEKKELVENFNKFRAVSLRNSDDLLRGAKAALNAGVEHASFHLSLLAFEEIGKIEMETIRTMSLLHSQSEPLRYNLSIDDHERKIFFAFWGHTFGREKQTKALIDTDKNLAKTLHDSRLLYLYSDPGNPQHWSELMSEGEAKRLYDLVELRLKMANAGGELAPENALEPNDDLRWFFEAQEDDQKKKEIWGHKSQDKLIELKDTKAWIKWLRETYEKHEHEMREISARELQRQKPSEKEQYELKWRITVEIVSPSHSIQQKHLKKFNEVSEWIKIKYKNAHTLVADFLFFKNLPIQGLWWHGWGMARMFVVALNVATHGFFWWNLKPDPVRFYKEIWDLENNLGVDVRPSEEVERDWDKFRREKRWVLREADLTMASMVFSYLADCRIARKENHLNRYVAGLTFLAKNDIHFRFEMNTFEEFFAALRLAMIENDDWDEKESFADAYLRVNAWQRFKDMPPKITEDMRRLFELGFKVETEHKGAVNLSAIYAIKNYCEIYFQTLAIRHIEKRDGAKVQIVMGSPDSLNE